jgi:hypothetical protein
MKKAVIFVLILGIVLSLAACGSSPATEEPAAPGASPEGGATKVETTAPATPAAEPAYTVTYQKATTYTNSIGTTWVQCIAEIENTGSVPLYLSSGSYDLEDSDGNLVASQTLVSEYPVVLDVGEKGYMYDEDILEDVEGGTELTLVPRISAEAAKIDLVRLNVTDVQISDDKYGGVKALGRVENTTTEEQDMVYVAIVLFDAAGTPIGLLFTILMDPLKAGDKIGFEASTLSVPDSLAAASVASYTTYAYPMQMQF